MRQQQPQKALGYISAPFFASAPITPNLMKYLNE
jgi:hypothetical protein